MQFCSADLWGQNPVLNSKTTFDAPKCESQVNALRHSAATAISIELSFDEDGVGMEIVDNGCGFDARTSTDGSGVSGMRDRARRLGGELLVCSEVGLGSRVSFHLPVIAKLDEPPRNSMTSYNTDHMTITTHTSDLAAHRPEPEEYFG
jgi:signal transduction histidine kinase